MGIRREIIRIDEEKCNGCGLCVPNCAEGSLVIVDGKAKMIADRYCDGLGACLGHCPQGALSIEVREADEYDHHAVEELLKRPEEEREALARGGECCDAGKPLEAPLRPSGGCPGSGLMRLTPTAAPNGPRSAGQTPSSLSHWPIQLRLVPPDAPFLQGADLLVAADCVAGAVPDFHARFVPGRVLLMGCPKFDDVDFYLERLEAIFRNNAIRSVTLVQMEVPCCSNLAKLVLAALERSGSRVAVERVVAARTGGIITSEKLA